MDGTEIHGPLGPVFRSLIGPALDAAAIRELGVLERGMYLVVRIKTHLSPLLYDRDNNTTIPALVECLTTVCPDAQWKDTDVWVDELMRGWAVPGAGYVRFNKADNVTALLVALVVYNQGGWVRYEGELIAKPDFR